MPDCDPVINAQRQEQAMRARSVMRVRRRISSVCRAAVFTGAVIVGPTALADSTSRIDDPRVASAWRVLRTLNCERCHGKDYEGLAAPSVVAYARTQSRESFVRVLLEGDPPRGMPGYRANPLVSENIEGIYRYFLGRANGAIGATARPKSHGDASEP